MLLFINPSGIAAQKIILPLARVYDIYCLGCSININYDSGELVEVDGTYQKKLDTCHITFDSEDDVNKICRQFYKACNSGAGAFFFGNSVGNSDDEKKK